MNVQTQSGGYWSRRTSRRALLRGATATMTGAAAAFALACKSSTTDKAAAPSGGSSSSSAASTATSVAQAQQAAGVNALIGRSGQPATGKPAVAGGVYRSFFNANPASLDPHGTSNVFAMNAAGAVYSRLLRYKAVHEVAKAYDREIEGDLASGWETADAVTWTLKLRPNVKFQNVAPLNGRLFDAEDVKASFGRALSPVNANRGSLAMIDPAKIETPDKNTVVFKLNYPYAPFASTMASGVYGWILPREVNGGGYDPAKQMIGTGPFILDSYTPDVKLVWKKNPDWFDVQGKLNLAGVEYAIIPDPAARLAQFTAGNTHYVTPSADDLETMKKQNPKAEVISQWDPGDGQLYLPLGDPASPFQDIRIRQAMALAINREAYGKVIKQDKYTLGFNVPPSFGKWALKSSDLPADVQQYLKFDLPRAKKLMEDAGGDKLTVKMLKPTPYPPDPWFTTAGELVFNMLKALPWNIQFINIDYTKDWVGGGKGVRYGALPNDSFVWGGLEGRFHADEYLYGFWHSKSTASVSKLNDPAFDQAIDNARAQVKEDAQVKAYIDAQAIIASKLYCPSVVPMGLSYIMLSPQVNNYLVGDQYGIAPTAWANMWLSAA